MCVLFRRLVWWVDGSSSIEIAQTFPPQARLLLLTRVNGHPFPTGIVFDIAKLILDNNGDIQESRMMRMGCDFTLMMVLLTSPSPFMFFSILGLPVQ